MVDSGAYSTFASVGSDHRVVVMKVRLCLRAPPKATIKGNVQYEWWPEAQGQQRAAREVRCGCPQPVPGSDRGGGVNNKTLRQVRESK